MTIKVFVDLHMPALPGPNNDHGPEIAEFLTKRSSPVLPNQTSDREEADLIVTCTGYHPFIDLELLRNMCALALESGARLTSSGAIPGTSPLEVAPRNASGRKIMHWPTQVKANSLVDIKRGKRLKIFLALKSTFKDLHAWSVEKLISYLSSDEGVAFVMGYGEHLELESYTQCPLCRSAQIVDLLCATGQPVIGFLTAASRYYHRCNSCGLIFLSPVPRADQLGHLYDSYDLEEPSTPEDPDKASYRRHFLMGLQMLGTDIADGARVLDLGGGRGGFARLAKRTHPRWKVTVWDHRAPQGTLKESFDVRQGDFLQVDLGSSCWDLITMWEVVEHVSLSLLADFFHRLARALAPGGYLLLSTPDSEALGCQALDFWAAFPPHHVSVLSESVLRDLLDKAGLAWTITRHESLPFLTHEGYLAHAVENHRSMASRAEASLLMHLYKDVRSSEATRTVARDVAGTELIMLARKPY